LEVDVLVAAPPLVSLRGVRMAFGARPLFTDLDVHVLAGDRLGLVGRNGAGKSTLLRLLEGSLEPDAGKRVVQAGVRLAHLPQDPRLDGQLTALACALSGGAEPHRAQAALDRLGVDPEAPVATLSGGQSRRVALARALAAEPDVLLLDEPTNHLDLPTIQWLEAELARFRGGAVVISHDRAFLRATTRGLLWLRRGRALRSERGFAEFERVVEEVERAEAAELSRLEIQLQAEQRYAERGVSARRTRNERRVAKLAALRVERAELLSGRGAVSLTSPETALSGKLVIEAKDLHKAYGDTVIVRGFSTRILRGDRVGLIGPNGAGKSTLLRLLTGEEPPDRGTLRLGTNVEIARIDQHRATLDPEATLWETLVPGGGDTLHVQGRPKHVVGYLKEFLFDAGQAHAPVKTLSGGEQSRLLLAKLFAAPSSLLVLDEPTNDLDMETLDLLEEVLADYPGTLLLVSHDRDFLDRLVTSTIAVEGGGDVQEYPGGYADYERQRRPSAPKATEPARAAPRLERRGEKAAPRKLTFNETRELERLPQEIAAAEAELGRLDALLADPGAYERDPVAFEKAFAEVDPLRRRKEELEERWLELELRREALLDG
jgi:ABC transport system ATP-binding/permease protein